MIIKLAVEVEVRHVSGTFAAKSDIAKAIREEIEGAAFGASISGLDCNGNSDYEVVDVQVEGV